MISSPGRDEPGGGYRTDVKHVSPERLVVREKPTGVAVRRFSRVGCRGLSTVIMSGRTNQQMNLDMRKIDGDHEGGLDLIKLFKM